MQRLEIGKLTDRGRAREYNQDNLITAEGIEPVLLQKKGVLCVVADGLGKAGVGTLASDLAVRAVLHEYYSDPSSNVQGSLGRAIDGANRTIISEIANNPAYVGMATTLVAAVVRDSDLFVANVGDSRAYLIRGQAIWQITQDHSWAAEQVQMERMTPEEAAAHPKRRHLTRSLGTQPEETVDHFHQRLQPGDRVLLCSDGLSDHLSDDEMRRIVARYRPQSAVQQLIALANQRGGADNITALVVGAPGGLSLAAIPVVPLAAGAAVILLVFLLAIFSQGPSPLPTPQSTSFTSGPEVVVSVVAGPAEPTPAELQAGEVMATSVPGPSVTPSPGLLDTPAVVSSPPASAAPVKVPSAWTPTPSRHYAAPALREPEDQAAFSGPNAVIVLSWEAVGVLSEDEYYLVTIPFPHDGGTWHETRWLKDTSFQVPRYLYDLLSGSRECEWYTTVMRQTGTRADQSKEGVAISDPSETRTFVWHLSAAPSGPTPTPPFEKEP